MVYNKNVLDWLASDARNSMTWFWILYLTLDFYIIYYSTYLIYTSFATVLTVEPIEYLEYKIKDGLVSFELSVRSYSHPASHVYTVHAINFL